MADDKDITAQNILDHMRAMEKRITESFDLKLGAMETRMTESFDRKFSKLSEKIDHNTQWLNEGIDKTLTIVENIDKQLTKRLDRIEQRELPAIKEHIGLAA